MWLYEKCPNWPIWLLESINDHYIPFKYGLKEKPKIRISRTWILDEGDICATTVKENPTNNALCKGDGGGPLVCQEQGTER